MNLHGKQHSPYYAPLFMLKFIQNEIIYWDLIILKKCQIKLQHSAKQNFLVKCLGITRSMNLCWKQNKCSVLPSFMLIKWQSLVLYSDFIKKVFILNGIILPLNATLGNCPSITQAMNLYEKQHTGASTLLNSGPNNRPF